MPHSSHQTMQIWSVYVVKTTFHHFIIAYSVCLTKVWRPKVYTKRRNQFCPNMTLKTTFYYVVSLISFIIAVNILSNFVCCKLLQMCWICFSLMILYFSHNGTDERGDFPDTFDAWRLYMVMHSCIYSWIIHFHWPKLCSPCIIEYIINMFIVGTSYRIITCYCYHYCVKCLIIHYLHWLCTTAFAFPLCDIQAVYIDQYSIWNVWCFDGVTFFTFMDGFSVGDASIKKQCQRLSK